MPKKFVWLFSKKYIAGETINDAIRVSKELNAQSIKVTVDLLGEFITKNEQSYIYKDRYLEIIDTFQKHNIDGYYSLKPTMFGLLIDKEICYKNIREIVKKANDYNNFTCLDMEDSRCTDLEIELFRKLKAEFFPNVGLVFQAYLKRTLNDIKELLNIYPNDNSLNCRLCKGIYVEPKEISYKKPNEINQHFLENLEFMFQNKIYVGIATHDKILIENTYRLIEKYNVPKNKYEFQMLYGVTPELKKSIIDNGHTMRVYVPFGKDWLGYSLRRLKENPKMVSSIIKSMLRPR